MRQWIEDISRIVSRLDRAENKGGRRPRRFYLACSIRGALGLSSSGLASVPPANYATVGLKASFGQVFWNSFRGGGERHDERPREGAPLPSPPPPLSSQTYEFERANKESMSVVLLPKFHGPSDGRWAGKFISFLVSINRRSSSSSKEKSKIWIGR